MKNATKSRPHMDQSERPRHMLEGGLRHRKIDSAVVTHEDGSVVVRMNIDDAALLGNVLGGAWTR